ncbi:DUF6098 family protein [Streptomyces sp. NPDC092296]|uniref:DUF6098 family protein n=1 Tax=Streptomyces sp. NPDC092296 TaxID=3366012 RepID=UPI00382059D3
MKLRVLDSLQELTALVQRRDRLFIRWSRGPGIDLGATAYSCDDLTGVPLPGLSASPLHVEPWWDGRPVRLWVARRLYDYSHLRWEKGPGVHPWLLEGREIGRGPDNEPLVDRVRPVARVSERVIDEAEREIRSQPHAWGPLRRPLAWRPPLPRR